MRRLALRQDLGSLFAIGVGAVGGVALTAAFLGGRSHVGVHEHLHLHEDHDHTVSVWVTPHLEFKHAVEDYKVLIDAEKMKYEVMHEMEITPEIRMSGPEPIELQRGERKVRVRVESRTPEQRRRR